MQSSVFVSKCAENTVIEALLALVTKLTPNFQIKISSKTPFDG